jgi:hypothetical protein
MAVVSLTTVVCPAARSKRCPRIVTAIVPLYGRRAPLVGDLLRSPSDAGRATAFLVLDGNTFGLLAPIVTGYVIAQLAVSTRPSPVRDRIAFGHIFNPQLIDQSRQR